MRYHCQEAPGNGTCPQRGGIRLSVVTIIRIIILCVKAVVVGGGWW